MTEPRNRATLGFAAVLASLDERLENEGEVLDAFLLALSRGQLTPDAWPKLHASAQRDDRLAELAFAFEQVAADRRLRTLQAAVVAEFMFQAAVFFGDAFGDELGSGSYLDRALAAVPTHAGSLERRETQLAQAGDHAGIGEMYAELASHRPRGEQPALYRKAAAAFAQAGAQDRVADVLQALLRVDPKDEEARSRLEEALLGANRPRDVVKLFEQSLAADPPPPDDVAHAQRKKLLAAYGELGEPERALPHLEAILAQDPNDEVARETALALLEQRSTAGRAAAALAQAAAATGAHAEAARFHTLELEHVRGPRRAAVLKALSMLKEDHLSDPAGAYEAAEAALGLDPSDGALLDRFVNLTRALAKHDASTKTLSRLLGLAKDPATKARLSTATGELLLANGDVKRARAAFSSALTVPGAGEDATLGAARALARIYSEDEDHASLADMLERIVRAEPDADVRLGAAEQLAALASGALGDPARAIVAWKALLDSPARLRALQALEPLLSDVGDAIGLAEVLRARANASTDPEEQRALLLRAAEALTEASGNLRDASAAWRELIDRFGPSREILARWLPLLELEREWAVLDRALLMDAKLAAPGERAAVLGSLGNLRLQKMRDVEGSLTAFRAALDDDPQERATRAALEQMLEGSDDVLAGEAAGILEPVVRAEGSRPGLFRVLYTRATRAPAVAERLQATLEALGTAEQLPGERLRAMELAERALADAAATGIPLGPWIEAIEKLTPGEDGAQRRATALARALGDRAVDSPELLALARATGDAAMIAGQRALALDTFRRALEFMPDSPDLMASVELLLREQGTPEDRLRLYQSALARETVPEKRRTLFTALASVQRNELGDRESALVTLTEALREDPDNQSAAEALYEVHVESGAWLEACRLLEDRLSRTPPGEDERALHSRVAELAAAHGLPERAIEHARALLDDTLATATDLDLVEHVSEQLADKALACDLAVRRAEVAESPEERLLLLSRLGAMQLDRGEPAAAVAAWHEGAGIAEQQGDRKNARKLYERIRKTAPYDREATARLAAIVEAAGESALLPELFASLVEAAANVAERRDALLRLSQAIEHGGDFSGAFDAALRAFTESPADAHTVSEAMRLAKASGGRAAFLRAAETALGDELAPAERIRIVAARAEILADDPERTAEAANALRDVAKDPEAGTELREEVLRRLETIFGEHPDRAPKDTWRWLFEQRAATAEGKEKAQVLLRWARAEEQRFDDGDRALALYRLAAEVDPTCGGSMEVARLTLARGDVEGALASLRTQLAGANDETARRLRTDIAAILLSHGGRSAEALAELRQALETAPDDGAALKLVAGLLADETVGDEASALLETAVQTAADEGVRSRALRALLDGATDAPAERRIGWHQRAIESAEAQGTEEAYAALLAALSEYPTQIPWWDRSEQLARKLDRPADLGELYQRILAGSMDAETADEVGQRAVAFHEEWFEDPSGIVRILERLVDLDPSGWAFDRLKLLFDAQERWEELFHLYDRVLAADIDEGRKVELLEDAAQIAKDFAKNADRAISYLEQLLNRKPKNERLIASLERLYERHGRHRELVSLLEVQLGGKTVAQAQELRSRIARIWLDELSDAGAALLVVEEMLAAGDDGEVTRELLERILGAAPAAEEIKKTLPPTSSPVSDSIAAAYESIAPPRASVPPRASAPPRGSVPPPAKGRAKRVLVRQRAAGLLRERYSATGKDADLARVLEVELEGVKNAKDRIRRHREITALYERIGNDAAALEHSVSLVMLEPESEAHRSQLASLAERTGRWDRLAEVLAAAADDCEGDELRVTLLMDAGLVHADRLSDGARAIELLARVLAFEVDHGVLLRAARRLETLLGQAGREHERLGVLERIAQLETDVAARKSVLGEAARVAAMLGESDRGVAAWQARLSEDDQDLEAATGLVTLLETAERHRPLYEALERRARLLANADERRDDRVRAARLLSDQLADPVAAIGAWEAIEKDFGDAEDSTSALAALYAQEKLWDRQATLLTRAADRATLPERRAELLLTLGDLQREHLDAPDDAVLSYEAALVAVPGEPRTLAGLRVLLSDARAADVAIDVLLASHRAADSWSSVLELTADRLRVAKDDATRIVVLLEVAELHERRAGDVAAAFQSVRDAFVLALGDVRIEGELARLADLAGAWRAYADAHRLVLDALEAKAEQDPDTLARLRLDLADSLENRLDDPRGALALLLRVAELAPMDEVAGTSAVRVAARIQRWDAAARVILDRAAAARSVDEGLLATLEANVAAPGGWDAATGALEAALAQRTELEPAVARDLEAKIASWHRDRRGDADAAEVAYGRALAHDPANAELLRAVAHLQRRNRGRPLIDSLLRLSQATSGDPELLREAAEVASSVVVDRGLAKSILERLLKLSAERWTGASDEAPMTLGSPSHPSEYVEWALAELVRIHNEEGNAERIVSLLAETAKLPFERQRARAIRHEAARVAQERLEDYETALTLYGALFDDDEDDTLAADRLAAVLGATDRKAELLTLRKRQIARATDRAVRVPLRLDVARIERELGHVDEAAHALRESLREEPRHPASTLALSSVLESAGRYADLVTFLAEQAELAERDTDALAAVELWARAAELAEQKLENLVAALGYYRRVLPLAVRPGDLDAIARLHERREEWNDAAEHLDRLALEFPEERPRIVLRLADDLVRAGREADARGRLEAALGDPRSPEELQGRLAELYRNAQLHAPLAELLTRQALRSSDDETKRKGLEEAAELFLARCGAPERAAELLLQASELAPDDRSLKLRLAEALSAAGRIDDARELLKGMLEAFGGRRPKERAQVHFHLARLQLKTGDRVHALAELEAAMRIDPANPEILRMVAELARDDGQLEKAERSYRALLSVLRRETGDAPPVARSEVLLELADIAERQGENERSNEILESAFEAATASESEGLRLEAVLRAKKQNDALLRALRARLERTTVAEKRAEVLLDVANVEQELGHADLALATRLGAIEAAPAAKAIHEAALAHARSIGATATYVDRVLELGDRLAGEGHAKDAAILLLRVGALLQDELSDPKRAAETLERASKADPSNAEVLRALDRTYASLEDPRQEAVLERLVALGAEQTARDPRAAGDVQYRLASLRLRRKETRDEGAALLRAAFDLLPDVDRALALVEPALEADATQSTLVALLEQLARIKADPARLVRAIVLHAQLGSASPELMREGVEGAERLGLDDAAERILVPAMAASDSAFAAWARLELASIFLRRNEPAAAAKLKLEAAKLVGGDEARRLRLEAAQDAHASAPEVARQAFEAILEEAPKDAEVQQQLLALLREGGHTADLAEALARAIDAREPSPERTALRLERARLHARDLGRADAAVEQLRELLDEDPTSDEAATTLVDLLEAGGNRAELTELLEKRLDAAKDRGDAAGVATLALRLGSLLEKDDPRRARTVFALGLDWEAANVDLLRASLLVVSAEDAADRSELLDRLLAVSGGAEAESLALELASLRMEQWDSDGAERALEAGLRGQPGSPVLRERLMSAYADRGDSAKLAALHELTAPAMPDAERRAAHLEAARLYTELGERTAVARVLRAAHFADPTDGEVLQSYLDALGQADDVPAACAELDALAPSLENTAHEARWLVERARLAVRDDRYEDAVAAAERAYAIDRVYADTLAEILALSASALAGDAQRSLRVRLAELLGELGRDDDARGQLEQLLTDDPNDVGALAALADLEERVERWDAAADVLQRLVGAQGDNLLSSTALRLADACERANVPGYAREGLEHAHRLAPTDPAVTARLADIYAKSGAVRELSILRLEEAELAEPEQRFPLLLAAATLLLGEGADPVGAAEALRKAQALKPNDLECAGLLADACLAMGDAAAADELLRGVLERQKGRRSKDLAHIYLRLARVARSGGDRKTDVAMLTTALDMDGQNGAVASELAWVARDEGNLDLETRALRTVTMLRTPASMPRAEAYERLGEIAIQQGDSKKAVMLLKRAIDDDPTRDRARELLASLD